MDGKWTLIGKGSTFSIEKKIIIIKNRERQRENCRIS